MGVPWDLAAAFASPAATAGAGQQLAWAGHVVPTEVEEGAPRIAPDVRAVPANRDLALARRWQVRPTSACR